MKKLVLLAACLVATQAAFGGALADKAKWDAHTEKMDAAAASVASDSYCGGKVGYTFDKSSFSDPDALNVASWCSGALDAIGAYCHGNPANKGEVTKAISSVTCHYDPALKAATNHATKITKSGSKVQFSYNKDSSNIRSEMEAYLKEAL